MTRRRPTADRPPDQGRYTGFRLTDELRDRLAIIARRENNTVSAVIRRLLTAGLDREATSR
jgi:predicted transcriptional regulator